MPFTAWMVAKYDVAESAVPSVADSKGRSVVLHSVIVTLLGDAVLHDSGAAVLDERAFGKGPFESSIVSLADPCAFSTGIATGV